ncbi:hypothetical protein GQ54DRAFT_315016, partial [Martensiomyces pterosporus]
MENLQIHNEVASALAVPSHTTANGSFLRTIIGTLFSYEQEEIPRRDRVYRKAIQTTKHFVNHIPEDVQQWQKIDSTSGHSGYTGVAVKIIWALMELSKGDMTSRFLHLTSFQQEAASDLAQLIDRHIATTTAPTSSERVRISQEADEEMKATAVVLVFRVLRSMWVAGTGEIGGPPMSDFPLYRLLFLLSLRKNRILGVRSVRSLTARFIYWARITLDIDIQLRLAAWRHVREESQNEESEVEDDTEGESDSEDESDNEGESDSEGSSESEYLSEYENESDNEYENENESESQNESVNEGENGIDGIPELCNQHNQPSEWYRSDFWWHMFSETSLGQRERNNYLRIYSKGDWYKQKAIKIVSRCHLYLERDKSTPFNAVMTAHLCVVKEGKRIGLSS